MTEEEGPTIVVCSPRSWGHWEVPSTEETCVNCGADIWLSEGATLEPDWQLWCFGCAYPHMDLDKPLEPAPWVPESVLLEAPPERVREGLRRIRRFLGKS